MVVESATDLAVGGVCAWRLPSDETGPAAARSFLQRTLDGLGVERDVVEDGKLAVSETATNALRYGHPGPHDRPHAPPELWVWARTVPSPQLIVSVFDCARTSLPHASGADLLDERGKGLAILEEFTAGWGCALTRSRVAERAVPGKAVWFALPLPLGWPGRTVRVHPGTAAQCLLLNVTRRGFRGTRCSDERGVSVVVLTGLNVWVHHRHFCWWASETRYVRRPLIDLQEAEQVVRHLDAGTGPACSPTA
ncbi:ATP-binding protein [Spirillospora sp. NPDC046719]